MFGHLVDQAKLRVTIAATHYGGRVVVAALLLVAVAFGVAAIFVLIAHQAGIVVACVTMAVAFLVLAIVLAMIMLSREKTQRIAMRQAAHQTAMSASMASMVPNLVAGGRRLAKTSGLNMPLVLGSAVVAALLAMRVRANSSEHQHDR